MDQLDFTAHEDPAALLTALLEGSGIPYRRERGLFRFLLSTRGYRWETLCRCRGVEVLIYGRYPFRVQACGGVLKACGEVNAQVLRGGMFPWEDQVLFRTTARCAEPLNAAEELACALEYNTAVVAEFWPLMQRAATEDNS